MAKRSGMYSSNKRKKEMQRKKKQEEKRQRRQKSPESPLQVSDQTDSRDSEQGASERTNEAPD